jgi:hypothetical protein
VGSDRRRLSARRAFAVGCAAAIAAAGATGCTTQQAYSSAQAWQRNECNRQVEQTARERCLAGTGMSYDDYRRRTEDGPKQ